MNIHSGYIAKRIRDIERKDKWSTEVIPTDYAGFARDFNHYIFNNICTETFTRSYVRKYTCECGLPAKQRCHGIDEERGVLLRRAYDRVCQSGVPIRLKDIVIAFLWEHTASDFCLKCVACHKAEDSIHSIPPVAAHIDETPPLSGLPWLLQLCSLPL